MTQEEKAKKLDISQGFFSKIYNGYGMPSFETAERWRPVTGWSYSRWKKATTSQIQKLLDRIGG